MDIPDDEYDPLLTWKEIWIFFLGTLFMIGVIWLINEASK